MNKASISLKPVPYLTETARRRTERVILEQDRRAATERRGIAQQVERARSDYRRQLADLMGRSNMRRYRELRKELARVPGAARIRQSRKWLAESGVDLTRAERLRQAHLVAIRELLETTDSRIPPRVRPPLDDCSPWVTYTGPYGGSFWVYAWTRSDQPDDPVLNRYLDTATGHIGSSIDTRLTDADDDDFVQVDYYTSLNVWHTVQATGILEGYLAFEFNASPYSGKVRDEFGWSFAMLTQWAYVRFRVVDPSGPWEIQDNFILHHSDVVDGGNATWNKSVAAPREIRSYFFRTAAPFEQGHAVLLEAGIHHGVTFSANDESVTTAANLDLRLDRIQVRSCPGPRIR